MQKIKLARMGNKEARGLLVRDRNKLVATAAIRSPKMTENEVESFAKARNVSDEVLRIIASQPRVDAQLHREARPRDEPEVSAADGDQVPELPPRARAAPRS